MVRVGVEWSGVELSWKEQRAAGFRPLLSSY